MHIERLEPQRLLSAGDPDLIRSVVASERPGCAIGQKRRQSTPIGQLLLKAAMGVENSSPAVVPRE
jgi:hypothetical protein